MSAAAKAGLVLLGIAVGFGAGLLVRRERPEARLAPPGGEPASKGAPVVRDDRPAAAAETSDPVELRRRNAEQAEEIKRLRAQVGALESKIGGRRTREEKLKAAKEIYELFVKAVAGGNGADIVKALGRLNELDEEMGGFFVERLREARAMKEGQKKDMALFLMTCCGGKEVSAYVCAQLNDAGVPAEEREEVLRAVSGIQGLVPKRLPLDAELGQTAMKLLASSNAQERMGGAGLLGGREDDESRIVLRRLADADPDLQVRAAAVASLGVVGDRATLEYLESYPAPDPKAPQSWMLTRTLEQAKAALKQKLGE